MSSALAKLTRFVVLAFVLLLLIGVVAAMLEGSVSTRSPITTLEAGMRPETDAIRVEDGLLYWPAAITYYREHLRTKERVVEGYYVPLVSAALADRLQAGGETPAFDDVAALVFIHQASAERDFPWLADEDEELPAPARFDIQGPWKPGKTLPLVLKQQSQEHFPGLDEADILVIAHDAPSDTNYGFIGLGVLFLAVLGASRGDKQASPDGDSEPLLENEGTVVDFALGDGEHDYAQAGWPATHRQR